MNSEELDVLRAEMGEGSMRALDALTPEVAAAMEGFLMGASKFEEALEEAGLSHHQRLALIQASVIRVVFD